MAEAPEIKGSQRYTPRSVQPGAMLKTTQQLAGRRINIHVTETGAVGFKHATFLMQHVCHYNVISDGLHIEGHKIARQALIDEYLVSALVIVIETSIVRSVSPLIVCAQLHTLELSLREVAHTWMTPNPGTELSPFSKWPIGQLVHRGIKLVQLGLYNRTQFRHLTQGPF
jgi:hypothetical protein